jgi:histone H3/H4
LETFKQSKATKDTAAVGRRKRAGLKISVSGVENLLRKVNPKKNISGEAPVYLSGIVESFIQSLVTNTINHLETSKKKTISPSFINLAINDSAELSNIFSAELSA